MSFFKKKKERERVMLFDLLFSLQNLTEIKKKKIKNNGPVPQKLVRSSLSTTEAFKKKRYLTIG